MTIKNSQNNIRENLEVSDRFVNLVDEITALEELVAERKDEIKDVYLKAKAEGYNIKAMKQVIREKRSNGVKDQELYEATVDEYRSILGLFVC